MMFLLQGQSDPLMPGRRKANMKCQSSMDISGVRTICIYEVIGWFRIGFVMSPVLEKTCWSVREQSSYQGCISLFFVCIHQCLRSCSRLMLIQAFYIGGFFSCILEIEL